MSSVEQTLAQLSGAKLFSKLDENSQDSGKLLFSDSLLW